MTINYDRQGGIETRTALIDCTVNQYGRAAISEAEDDKGGGPLAVPARSNTAR